MDTIVSGGWWPLALPVLGVLVYLGLTWNHDYWKKRGVPYAKPLPLIGNMKDSILVKKSIGQVYRDIYENFEGHRFVGMFAPVPSLLIRDPELIKEILVRDFTSFHDNNIEIDIKADPLFARNPFVERGESWKVSRSRLIPAFTASKLKTLFPLIPEVCRELKDLLKNNDCSGEFEAKELCSRFTTNVVTMCGYGINGNSIKNPDSEFRRAGREIFDPSLFNQILLSVSFVVPSFSKLFSIRFLSKSLEKLFQQFVEEVITLREEQNVTRNDYIQHLIDLKKKIGANGVNVPEEYPFTNVDVAAHAMTLFLDGVETSSSAFSFALYAIATNPDVQRKLREEVNSVLKEDGGKLTYDGLQKMSYLDMVLSESLRLYTPLNFMTKICTNPIKLQTPSGKEFTVEKGTPVHIPLYAIHRDPKYFKDPETFNPENFSEENKKNRHKYVYLPFGEGPRTCLGRRFAVMQVKAGIAAIVSSFEISPTSRTPSTIVPDPSNFFLGVKEGLWLKFSFLNDDVFS